MASYTTLVGDADVEIDKIKGSRFWAFARSVADEAEAMAFVDELRRVQRGAGHYCYAWRLGGEEERTRSSDDGEPGGTAGRPILREIEARGLRNACVVVLRWFGGTKLGTGGLVRAYGGAARAVLADAPTLEIQSTLSARVRFAYADTALVEAVLRACALRPTSADYAVDVTLSLAVPPEELEALERALRDATAGRLRLELEP
jgi:uncharacterized YigZ family protein